MTKYVIVGGSIGGIGAVEAIREVDPIGTMSVITEEGPYARPLIADFLSGETSLENLQYRDDTFWAKHRVQVFKGRKAVSLNLTNHYVELGDGATITFEKLLLATGGQPFVPKMEGLSKDGVFTFTSLSDTERIAAKINEYRKAVVIGGGLIGISAAEALMKQGVHVTVVELKDNILNLLLDSTASDLVANKIRRAGVDIITGQTVQRILGKNQDSSVVGGVVLTNGEELSCDVVVIAIGVIPRTELVVGTAVKVNRGIIVDEFMCTSIPNVYACGDVAETYDFVLGESRLLPLWPLAHLGGRIAGFNMAGKSTTYPGGTSMSALKYFDLPVISVGRVHPQGDACEVLVTLDPAKSLYKKIVLKKDIIVGMTFVNDVQRAGLILYLMQNYVNVRDFKESLISENFGLATLPPSLRKKMFMGN